MKIGKRPSVVTAAAALLAGVSVSASAQQQSDAAAIKIGEMDIGGVISSPQGREAGVWVIAETTELPTQFRRIVVTDDQGRYLVPDLPQADYSVWVRGYGLIDSPKMRAKPGQRLDLAATPAPSAADAAHYYPAIYWYSLLTIPDKNQFGGLRDDPDTRLGALQTGDDAADVLFADFDRGGIALLLRGGRNRHPGQQRGGGRDYQWPLSDLHGLLPAGSGPTDPAPADLLDAYSSEASRRVHRARPDLAPGSRVHPRLM